MPSFDANSTADEVVTAFKTHVAGKTFIVTGPSEGGLGAAAARSLAIGSPGRLILVGRSKDRILPVIQDIEKANSAVAADFVRADFMDNASVRSAAAEIKRLTNEVHGLINNAGIMAPQEFSKSKDGIESQFASNHIGHFLLTNLLFPEIKRARGVVTNVTSRGYQISNVNLEDPNFQDGRTYNGWMGYARAKTANILFSVALAKRMRSFGGTSFSANPGYVGETMLQKNNGITSEYMMSGFELAKERNKGEVPQVHAATLAQGAATMVVTVLDPALRESSGSFLEQCKTSSVDAFATDPEAAEGLWGLSEKLVGQEFAW